MNPHFFTAPFCVLEIGDWGQGVRYQAEMTYSAV